jgi:hypothetical protein
MMHWNPMGINAISFVPAIPAWVMTIGAVALSFLKMSAAAIVFVACLARIGHAVPEFLRLPAGISTRFTGASLLAGFTVFGAVVAALAMSGLLYPVLVLGCLFSLAVPSRLSIQSMCAVIPPFRSMPLAVLTALGVAALALKPVTGLDAHVCHLASAWQFLGSHRMLVSCIPASFLYPLPVEMVFTLPLIAGDDRITTLFSLAALASVVLVVRETAGIRGALMLLLLSLSISSLAGLVASGKNDVIASSFFMAGALLLERGGTRYGALMLGACISAKPVYGPLVGLWWLFMRPQRTRLLGWSALLLFVPILPWWIKSFLATGNPFYPFGADRIATFGWTGANMGRYMDYWGPLWMEGTRNWRTIPGALLRGMSGESLLAAVALPGLLVFAPARRRPVLVILLAWAITLRLGHVTRYCLPSLWLAVFYLAEWISSPGGKRQRILVLLSVTWAACAIALNPSLRDYSLGDLNRELQGGGIGRNGTFGEACRMVESAGLRRVIVTGELRTYLLPARAVYDGMIGETPVIWGIVHESFSPADIARKIRQAGINGVLYNYVSAMYGFASTGYWFPWDRRMGHLWEEYCRSGLDLVSATPSCDHLWGGYCLYKTRPVLRRKLGSRLFYLPGADALAAEAGVKRSVRDHSGSARLFSGLSAEFPAVLSFRCEAASEYARMFMWRETVGLLGPVMASGMVHPAMPMYGMALAGLEEYARARIELKKCLGVYRADETMIRLGLANCCIKLALAETRGGRLRESEKLLDEGGENLEFVPTDNMGDTPATIREYRAWILALRAGNLAARGKCGEASAMYMSAAGMVPGSGESRAWKARAGNPCRQQ